VAAIAGQARAQAVSDSRVSDLLAQAKTQIVTAAPQAKGGALSQSVPGLPLTMDEAVAKALQLNIDLAVARLNPQVQDWGIAVSFGPYVPNVTATIGERSQTSRPGSQIGGGATVNTNATTAQHQALTDFPISLAAYLNDMTHAYQEYQQIT
jgi:outer membrane protein TolC